MTLTYLRRFVAANEAALAGQLEPAERRRVQLEVAHARRACDVMTSGSYYFGQVWSALEGSPR